jgi:competence protein ComEC
VRFALLAPRAADYAGGAKPNELSCVLRVAASGGSSAGSSSAGGSLLLTGDIERGAEAALAAQPGIGSDVLLVPHHGSRTSSTAEFIAAVAPRWAVVPAGYRNRFGHPAREVLERYRSAGVQVLRTDLDGAITVALGGEVAVTGERALRPRYWRRSPGV